MNKELNSIGLDKKPSDTTVVVAMSGGVDSSTVAGIMKNEGYNVIADFIAPTPAARELFPADYIVWVDTIKAGRFDDTNQMFVKPEKYNFHVTSQNAKIWAPKILEDLTR